MIKVATYIAGVENLELFLDEDGLFHWRNKDQSFEIAFDMNVFIDAFDNPHDRPKFKLENWIC